jgi:hypothetical protein
MSFKIRKSISSKHVASDNDDDDDNDSVEQDNINVNDDQLMPPPPVSPPPQESESSSEEEEEEDEIVDDDGKDEDFGAKKKPRKKRKQRDDDDDDDDNNSASEAEEVDHEQAEKEDRAAAKGGAKAAKAAAKAAEKIVMRKIEPLAKPMLTPDAKYSNGDRFEFNFVPVAREGEYLVGLVPMLTIRVDDQVAWNSMGITTLVPQNALRHSCGMTPMMGAATSKHNDDAEKRRQFLNKSREMLKVSLPGDALVPRVSFVYVAMRASTSTANLFGVRTADLRCASVVFRCTASFESDVLGTLNFSRAMVCPHENFPAMQQAMERAIPITSAEERRFCFIDAEKERSCLTSIPLMHNCAARFQFLGLAPTPFPDGISFRPKPGAARPVLEKLKSTSSLATAAAAATDKIISDDWVNEFDAGNTAEMASVDFRPERNNDDEDADKDDKIVAPTQMDADDKEPTSISELFAMAKRGDAPDLIEQEKSNGGGGGGGGVAGEEIVDEWTLDNQVLAGLIGCSGNAESEINHQLDVTNYVASVVDQLCLQQQESKVYYRPLATRLAVLRERAQVNLRIRDVDNIFRFDSAESIISCPVLRAASLSNFIHAPCHVADWEREWKIEKELPLTSLGLTSAGAKNILETFSQTGNSSMKRRGKGLNYKTELNVACLKPLGVSYRAALGFVYAHIEKNEATFMRIMKQNLTMRTQAGLMVALKKIIDVDIEGGAKLPSEDCLETVRRWWVPVLPEQFWRVACALGFRCSLYLLAIGAIDDTLRLLESDAPHLAIFSRSINLFRESNLVLANAEQTAEQNAIAQHLQDDKAAKKRSKKARAAEEKDGLSTAVFARTVWQHTNSKASKTLMKRVGHFFAYKIARMEKPAERQHVLRGVARLVVAKDARFETEALVRLFDVMLTALVELDGKVVDRAFVSARPIRERKYLDLFHPKQRQCLISVCERVNDSDAETQRAVLEKMDHNIGLPKESWATPGANGGEKPVHIVIVQKSSDFDACNSVVQSVTGDEFARFGVDCMRFDMLEPLATRFLQRLEHMIFEEPQHFRSRFHLCIFSSEMEFREFQEIIDRRQRARPSTDWQFFLPVWPPYANATAIETRRARKIAIIEKDGIDCAVAVKNKMFLYFFRADLVTHTEFENFMLVFTTHVYSVFLTADSKGVDPARMLSPWQTKMLEALRSPPLLIDDETRQLRRQALEGGLCGDYLYLSGLALHRGTYLGKQLQGPSLFEDLFFSCMGGNCCEMPLRMAGFATATARLRCWTEYVLHLQLRPVNETTLAIMPCDDKDERTVAIKYVNVTAHDHSELDQATQKRINVEGADEGSMRVPANVWMTPNSTVDGGLMGDAYGDLRNVNLDIKLDVRIGRAETSAPLGKRANVSRFIFADIIPDSSVVTIYNERTARTRERAWKFEKKFAAFVAKRRRQNESKLASESRGAPHPTIAPSLAQHSSILSRNDQQRLAASQAKDDNDDGELRFEPTYEDMVIVCDTEPLSVHKVHTNRLDQFIKPVLLWDAVMQPRVLAVTGFSIRELITIAAERPLEVVVVGSLEHTLRRLALTTIKPEVVLRTEIESYKLTHDTPAGRFLPVLDCYSVNYITSLPYLANIVLADGDRAHAHASVVSAGSAEN